MHAGARAFETQAPRRTRWLLQRRICRTAKQHLQLRTNSKRTATASIAAWIDQAENAAIFHSLIYMPELSPARAKPKPCVCRARGRWRASGCCHPHRHQLARPGRSQARSVPPPANRVRNGAMHHGGQCRGRTTNRCRWRMTWAPGRSSLATRPNTHDAGQRQSGWSSRGFSMTANQTREGLAQTRISVSDRLWLPVR